VQTIVQITAWIPILLLVVTTLAAAQPSLDSLRAVSRHWRCDPVQNWQCELPHGCQPAPPEKAWILLDFVKKTYQRCNRAGCDKYDMVGTESGVFTYVNLPGHPDTFLKIGKIGAATRFLEVAAIGVSALNSMGTCKAQ
jgi:hypothetical protein